MLIPKGDYFRRKKLYNLHITYLWSDFNMLMGNDCHDCSKYNRLEMKNVNKDILAWLEDIVEENNSRIERKEWKSKYNSYVVYDYEPFCTDGFEINLVIASYNSAYLNFIKYLYDEKISTIEYLNSCIGV